MDIIFLFIASIVCYFVLHAYYKEVQHAGASTPKAKSQRIILWSLVVVIIAVMMLVFVRQDASPLMMITPLIVGALAVLWSNLKARK